MFNIGIITDEVSQDISVAADFAARYGMAFVDIRSADGKGAFELTEKDWKHISEVFTDHGLSVRCIDAPLFKCSFSDKRTLSSHVESFRRLADLAAKIGCGIIRGFDFTNERVPADERAEAFIPIIDICSDVGIICALESDPSVHSSTAAELIKLLNIINSPRIEALFDPGNAFWVNPEADCVRDYELLRGRISHIHLKDALPSGKSAEAVCIGTGRVDCEKLLKRLAEDYGGGIAIETHYRKEGRLSEEQLRLPGGTAFSDGAYEASEECAEALEKLLARIRL